MIAPIIDELAAEYKDKLKCVKLNTDESPQVATDYGIRSIPTVCSMLRKPKVVLLTFQHMFDWYLHVTMRHAAMMRAD